MTLDQLKILVQIAESGSVLAAAEALHRTQPTLSVGIRKLEDELGLTLLARDQYRARLTPAGERICQQAREVLRQGTHLTDLAAHLASGHEARLCIAIEESCPVPLVLEVLRRLEKKYPQTAIELVGERLWGALERLEQSDADIAITPWFEENIQLQSFPFSRVQMVPVAAPDFLAEFTAHSLSLADLKDRVQVVVRDSSRQPRKKSLGVIVDGRRWLVNDHQTKKQILLAGMGWGRLQLHMIADELKSGQLEVMQIEDYGDRPQLEIRVARRRDEVVGPVAAELWKMFQALKAESGSI
ncbi:LysR family transcriptional regulator [Geopsychrobacter electrodiphilus]|uniref:LysR family transcriptional regulator n=1 Tax=Geopsychrobacter electrodiphilus TaxID=225196 RepID=UPI00036A2DBF|nr:LysR family transcriptional regulator [Geopsychrobacter electrodiphilus]